VRKALETPAIRQKLVELGNTPRVETVDQFKVTVKSDRVKWRPSSRRPARRLIDRRASGAIVFI